MSDFVSIPITEVMVDIDVLLDALPVKEMIGRCAWSHPVAFLDEAIAICDDESIRRDLSPFMGEPESKALRIAMIDRLDRLRERLLVADAAEKLK